MNKSDFKIYDPVKFELMINQVIRNDDYPFNFKCNIRVWVKDKEIPVVKNAFEFNPLLLKNLDDFIKFKTHKYFPGKHKNYFIKEIKDQLNLIDFVLIVKDRENNDFTIKLYFDTSTKQYIITSVESNSLYPKGSQL
jgi:hypothetical protein